MLLEVVSPRISVAPTPTARLLLHRGQVQVHHGEGASCPHRRAWPHEFCGNECQRGALDGALMLSWLCDVVGVGVFLVPLFLNCSEVDGRRWYAAASYPGLGNIHRSIISRPKRSHTGMDQPKR